MQVVAAVVTDPGVEGIALLGLPTFCPGGVHAYVGGALARNWLWLLGSALVLKPNKS